MADTQQFNDIKHQLSKALEYLEYSFEKVKTLTDDPNKLDQESLETWESFTARFARVADIFMAKYCRFEILQNDPAFRGTLRDIMNASAKQGLIDDVDTWMTIRGLRNISAHEYTNQHLQDFLQQLKRYTPTLLTLKKLVDS